MEIVAHLLVVVMTVLGTWFYAYQLVRGLKNAECHFKGQRVTRAGRPITYWAVIAIMLMWLVVLPGVCVVWLWRFVL